MSTEGSPYGPTVVRDAAGGLSLGLVVGLVLSATAGDLRWIGIGLAFGPGAGFTFGAVLRAARTDRA